MAASVAGVKLSQKCFFGNAGFVGYVVRVQGSQVCAVGNFWCGSVLGMAGSGLEAPTGRVRSVIFLMRAS